MNQSHNAQYELDPERLRQVLPDSPGVYCFKDLSGRVIYVGKAKSLKKRVLSYFRPDDSGSKTALMMRKASGLDFILTSTEKEAFILESNLIKKYMPRYNVLYTQYDHSHSRKENQTQMCVWKEQDPYCHVDPVTRLGKC